MNTPVYFPILICKGGSNTPECNTGLWTVEGSDTSLLRDEKTVAERKVGKSAYVT